MTAPSRRAGFSLVEVLAALAATVLIVGAFSPFAAQLVGGWGRGARTAELVDMMTTAQARLGRDIGAAVPMFLTRGEETSMLFLGRAGYVIFPAATGFGPGRGGFELVSLSVETADGRTALMRRRAPLGADPDAGGFRDAVALFEGRYRMAFTYVGADGVRREEWLDRPDLPVRVELAVLGPDGRPALAAPLVFAITANYPAACLADEPPEACAALEGDGETDGGDPQPDGGPQPGR